MKIALILTFLLTTFSLPAQKITFSGKVLDKESKQPLAQASVYLLNHNDSLSASNLKTLTDSLGHFSLASDIDNKIAITYIGYHTLILNIEEIKDSVNFYMIQSDITLDAANVIGFDFYNRKSIIHGDGIIVSMGNNSFNFITGYSFLRKDLGQTIFFHKVMDSKRIDPLSRLLNNFAFQLMCSRYFSDEEDFFAPSIDFNKIILSKDKQYLNGYLKSGYFWNLRDAKIQNKDIFYLAKILYNKDISKYFNIFPIANFGYNYNVNNDIDFLYEGYNSNVEVNTSCSYKMFFIRIGGGYYWYMDNKMRNTDKGFTYNIRGRLFSKHFLQGGLSGRGSFGLSMYTGYSWQQHQKGFLYFNISLNFLRSTPNPTYLKVD